MLSYFVKHPILANLLMGIIILGGIFTSIKIKKEVFPYIETNIVNVNVIYENAVPEDISLSIIEPIEEAILGMNNIKKVSSSARKASADINIEIEEKNKYKTLTDIENEINAISLPIEAEKPKITLNEINPEILSIYLYGDLDFLDLQEAAYQLKDKLINKSSINLVEVEELKNKIYITLKKDNEIFNITNEQIIKNIKDSVQYVTLGSITQGQKDKNIIIDNMVYTDKEIGNIPIKLSENLIVPLSEIATVEEKIDISDNQTLYMGKNSIEIKIFNNSSISPVQIKKETLEVLENFNIQNIETAIVKDSAKTYEQRLNLILNNALFGLILILILLGLFLEFKLAFWVAFGIPTAFLGTILLLPFFDISINMISMFAFIIALGIIIDDAIIVGENIYEHRLKGDNITTAAINGVKEMKKPLIFAIITNIVAFLPLMFVPGDMGKVFIVIPIVVIVGFLVSLFEVLFILPHHLGKEKVKSKKEFFLLKKIHNFEKIIEKGMNYFINKVYIPSLKFVIRYSIIFASIFILILSFVFSYVSTGNLGFSFMPTVESDLAVLQLRFKTGVSSKEKLEITKQYLKNIETLKENYTGWRLRTRNNSALIDVYLKDFDKRPLSTIEFNKEWEKISPKRNILLSDIAYRSDIGGPSGGGRDPIKVEILGKDSTKINLALLELENKIKLLSDVRRTRTSLEQDEEILEFQLSSLGKNLGYTNNDITKILRTKLIDNKVITFLRKQKEVEVYIEKENINKIELLKNIKINENTYLTDIGKFLPKKSKVKIKRLDGNIIESIGVAVKNKDKMNLTIVAIDKLIDEIKPYYPDVKFQYGGESKDIKDSMTSLGLGFIASIILLWAILAILYENFFTPFIVLLAIPFGIIGAVIGHMLIGYNLSVISILGILALSGIVINDSLILVNTIKENLIMTSNLPKAIFNACGRRFRPIMLTTLTTFIGLLPMIFETSVQAKFLIPMAISLAFGVLFATLITLYVVPIFYMIFKKKIK